VCGGIEDLCPCAGHDKTWCRRGLRFFLASRDGAAFWRDTCRVEDADGPVNAPGNQVRAYRFNRGFACLDCALARSKPGKVPPRAWKRERRKFEGPANFSILPPTFHACGNQVRLGRVPRWGDGLEVIGYGLGAAGWPGTVPPQEGGRWADIGSLISPSSSHLPLNSGLRLAFPREPGMEGALKLIGLCCRAEPARSTRHCSTPQRRSRAPGICV
jgi:hypothetical protein